MFGVGKTVYEKRKKEEEDTKKDNWSNLLTLIFIYHFKGVLGFWGFGVY